jgi:DNA-binding Lrp family transcriptional regulator
MAARRSYDHSLNTNSNWAALSHIDDSDRQVLRRLSVDGRVSYVRLGEELNLSASAIKRRVDRLQKRRIIRRFTIVTDSSVCGDDVEAFVGIQFREHSPTEEILSWLRQFPEIVGAWTIAGEHDALVHVRAADRSQLEAVLAGIRKQPGVQRTHSFVAFSRLIG